MHGILQEPIGYTSNSQRARVATERWAAENLYCPGCPSLKLEAGRVGLAVRDFVCPTCGEVYQLKSKRGRHGMRIMDSAYSEALAAARSNTFPHLLLLEYAHIPGPVVSLQAVPGAFVTPTALIQRKPLNPTARRAGWIGCDYRSH